MSEFFRFGVKVAQAVNTKTAAGLGGLGKSLGRAIGGAVQAAPARGVAVGKQLPPPPVPLPAGMSRGTLERTTGTILDSAGVPVPKKAPPPVPSVPALQPHGGMTPLQRKLYKNETGQAAPLPRTVGEFEAARGGQGPMAFQGEGSLYRPGQ